MTEDPAAFRPGDLIRVHGAAFLRTCFQTGKRGAGQYRLDHHHILGRGGKDPELRRAHSSVFNCAVLIDLVHAGPLRDDWAQRWVYLRVAFEKVMQAVGQGRYELTELDRAFAAHVRSTCDSLYGSIYDTLEG